MVKLLSEYVLYYKKNNLNESINPSLNRENYTRSSAENYENMIIKVKLIVFSNKLQKALSKQVSIRFYSFGIWPKEFFQSSLEYLPLNKLKG